VVKVSHFNNLNSVFIAGRLDYRPKLHLVGDFAFVAPVERQLSHHSNNSRKSTYGYYFNQVFIEPENASRQNVPDWIRRSAGHYDAIPYVFGGHYISQEYDHIVNGKKYFISILKMLNFIHKPPSKHFSQLAGRVF